MAQFYAIILYLSMTPNTKVVDLLKIKKKKQIFLIIFYIKVINIQNFFK